MKLTKAIAGLLALMLLLTACGSKLTGHAELDVPYLSMPTEQNAEPILFNYGEPAPIVLSDEGITLNGAPVSTNPADAVYTAHDIVYYESGKDFTYGEGSESDAHSPEEAVVHTVVHITQPGTYALSGKLSRGQIAVDLGGDAKDDPNAVVNLILNGVDITCSVAPAVIFYNVYECGSTGTETATKDVDTSAAGANVVIADGTVNNITGSYVARIYKPGSVVLNEAGTAVEEAKKLHKYDAAFYSKCSMNLYGGAENTGVLNISAANEGLDSELHLTINGGNTYITSGNDGINTNEDGVSVTTINGGTVAIQVTGQTGEGDGIDSNGWLVINGGTVLAMACSNSADSGIDSDMGIHINGGIVAATGNMLDRIEEGGQNYAVFSFAQRQSGGEIIRLADQDNKAVLEFAFSNAYSTLIFSSPDLKAGTYTLWSNGNQLAGSAGGMMGGFPGGMGRPGGDRQPGDGQNSFENFTPPEGGWSPEGATPPEGFDPSQGNWPAEGFNPGDWENFDWSQVDFGDFQLPEGGFERPEDFERPEGSTEGFQRPEGNWPSGGWGNFGGYNGETSTEFAIAEGGNSFTVTFA